MKFYMTCIILIYYKFNILITNNMKSILVNLNLHNISITYSFIISILMYLLFFSSKASLSPKEYYVYLKKIFYE